jgi:P pilus assembly chaperone PapD
MRPRSSRSAGALFALTCSLSLLFAAVIVWGTRVPMKES